MQFVRPSTKVSRKRNGRTCSTSKLICTKRSTLKKPGVNKNAKAFWSMRDAKANGEAYDHKSERHIENRASMRQALWEAHMRRPTAASEEALKRTEEGSGRAQSSATGWKHNVSVLSC